MVITSIDFNRLTLIVLISDTACTKVYQEWEFLCKNSTDVRVGQIQNPMWEVLRCFLRSF